jgi:hypothetical protein
LVALRMLDRSGGAARHPVCAQTDHFLGRAKPSYIGGIFQMSNERLFRFWADLDAGLKTGQPQNETSHGMKPMLEERYRDPGGSSCR